MNAEGGVASGSKQHNESSHRGSSATKTVKFFIAHKVNCVQLSYKNWLDAVKLHISYSSELSPTLPKVREIRDLRSSQLEMYFFNVYLAFDR